MESETDVNNETTENKGPGSPHWLKPNDLLRLRRAGKRRLQPRALQPVNLNAENTSVDVRKRDFVINPFRCASQKRPRPEDGSSQFLGRMSTPSGHSPSSVQVQKLTISKLPVDSYDDETCHSLSHGSNAGKPAQGAWQAQLPLDWSLKTRVRFCSPSHFPWNGSLKTCEEASGTTGFVRGVHASQAASESCGLDSSPQARFHQHCLVWMHPHLPWLRLFPRQGGPGGKDQGTAPSFFADPSGAARASLQADWNQSFRSLYQLVRARQCPFFYACAPGFTVLFRAAGVAGIPDLHALVTPTTRGLRQALREEGIQYSMPLCANQEQMDETLDGASQSPVEVKAEVQADDQVEDEPLTWLESLGLSQANFPSLNPKKSQMEEESREDRRPRSLVFVERENSQALFNFLLNSRACVCPTGPLAGVPPTLLAPVAFHGATLRSLKVRQGWVKQDNREMHMVEMSGPVLPSALQGLCTLFGNTQEGGAFSLVTAPHAPTAAFNAFQPRTTATPAAFATEALKDCGLPSTFVQQLCSRTEGTVPVLTAVKAEGGRYDVAGSV
ncbi:protein downstream neighbor of Son isoform X1 [Ixodes scapularis]|uniref:protein downstream neighbor of Son isoform X1 n=1 Tax=Ixodes scapularis TaxID=6945 RepID=UPI001C38FE2C|nr:protein downstream neighbor of Son isoform X1 [Ixodes scapularis]